LLLEISLGELDFGPRHLMEISFEITAGVWVQTARAGVDMDIDGSHGIPRARRVWKEISNRRR
jgi:hypothetical protein